jgi:ATP-dependent Clp protease ATP-binding subunit ClpB
LVLALLDDSEGLLRQAVTSAAGSEGTIASVERVLKSTLKKIPSQSPAPEASPPNPALIKCIRRAQSLQKSRGDSHLAVDQLIIALLDDGQITDCFKEAGISSARVKKELETVRGTGKKVENATGDTNFQALKKYGRDLVEEAAKLDPVIGRDDEIRRVKGLWMLPTF